MDDNKINNMNELKTLLEKVKQLAKNKEYNKVIEILTKKVLEKYNNSDLYVENAIAFWNLKKYEECKISANKALEINPSNAKALNYLGNVYSNLKDYEKAKEYYLKAIEIEPSDSVPYNNLGTVYYNLKDYKQAKGNYLKAIEIDSNRAYPYFNLGNVYFSLKDYEKAEEYYLKAIEIEPNDADPYFKLGNMYFNLKDFDKAKEYYLKAIEIDSNVAVYFKRLGNVYFSLKDYEKAKENYKKVINIDPNDADPYFNLGIVYEELKDYEKAKENYKKVINIDPNDAGSYFNLGSIYIELKDYKNAKENYQIYLKLDKNTEDYFYKSATSIIAQIEKIVEYSTYSKVNKIVEKIKELLKFNGEYVTHYSSISTIQFLIFRESSFRISEGSFLNDTSEGQELFNFLDYNLESNFDIKQNKETFTRKPFIGSFVDIEKNNDLTLWRMYGKEKQEEAKGCSISINANNFITKLRDKIIPNVESNSSTIDEFDVNRVGSTIDEFKFYRVAYRNGEKFEFSGAKDGENDELSKSMKELFGIIKKLKNDKNKDKNDETEVIELLNQIAFLFKSIEYKYENEIRLIIKDGIGFEKKIDLNNGNNDTFQVSKTPFKVYIELIPIHNLLCNITIGPKVNKAEEWASSFYYHLANKKLFPEIQVSKLPYK